MKTERSRDVVADSRRPKIVYVLTSALALRFLRGQFGYLHDVGYDVVVIASPGGELSQIAGVEGAQTFPIPIAREISPIKDLISLWRLWRVMHHLRPCITNVGTPKAGLLAGLAAFFAGVPCRIYCLYGLRVETTGGLKQRLLRSAERLACFCAHRVICVSESLRQKVVGLGLVDFDRTTVMSPGSCNGVDVFRFNLDQRIENCGSELRQKLGIPLAAPVIGFVGRFTRDKGISELLDAFASLRDRFPELRLLLVGDFEEGDPPAGKVIERIKTDPNIVRTAFVADTVPYYHVMDMLALPTYREGFPNVVLEAQAAGKPAVVTNATGAIDSVVDGVTGLIVPVGDSAALANALAKLIGDPSLANDMGLNGRTRAIAEFQPTRIWSGLVRQYESLLEAKGLPLPIAPPLVARNIRTEETGFVSSCVNSSNG